MLWNAWIISVLFKNRCWIFYNNSKILLWRLTLELTLLPSLSQTLTSLSIASLRAHRATTVLSLSHCPPRCCMPATASPPLRLKPGLKLLLWGILMNWTWNFWEGYLAWFVDDYDYESCVGFRIIKSWHCNVWWILCMVWHATVESETG